MGNLKGVWVDKLPRVLWAYNTTGQNATNNTPFSLTFGNEAIIHMEIGLPNPQMLAFEERGNDDKLHAKLNLLKEKKVDATLKIATY